MSILHLLVLPCLISDTTTCFWLTSATVAVLAAANIGIGLDWWHVSVTHVTCVSGILVIAVVVILIIILIILESSSLNSFAHCCALKPLLWSVHAWCVWRHVLVNISSTAWMCLVCHVVLISCRLLWDDGADVVHLTVLFDLWKDTMATLWRNQARNHFLCHILCWSSE